MKTSWNRLGGLLIRLSLAAVVLFAGLVGFVFSQPVALVDCMLRHGHHHM